MSNAKKPRGRVETWAIIAIGITAAGLLTASTQPPRPPDSSASSHASGHPQHALPNLSSAAGHLPSAEALSCPASLGASAKPKTYPITTVKIEEEGVNFVALVKNLMPGLSNSSYSEYTEREQPSPTQLNEIKAELIKLAHSTSTKPLIVGVAINLTSVPGGWLSFTCLNPKCTTAIFLVKPKSPTVRQGGCKSVTTNAYIAYYSMQRRVKYYGRVVIGQPRDTWGPEFTESLTRYESDLGSWEHGAPLPRLPLPYEQMLSGDFGNPSESEYIRVLLRNAPSGEPKLSYLTPYLGETLAEILQKTGPLNGAKAFQLGYQLIAQLMSHNYHMYDLKPDNVLGIKTKEGNYKWTRIDWEGETWGWQYLKCLPGFAHPYTGRQKDLCLQTRMSPVAGRMNTRTAQKTSREANAQVLVNIIYRSTNFEHRVTQNVLDNLIENGGGDVAWKAVLKENTDDFRKERSPLLHWGAIIPFNQAHGR